MSAMAQASLARRTAVDGPWGRRTLIFHAVSFVIPAMIAWTSTLNEVVYLPLIALGATLLVGLALLASQRSRRLGGRVIGATVLAFVLEIVIAVALVNAYSSQNPDWDLS
jgi:hypothetical protein